MMNALKKLIFVEFKQNHPLRQMSASIPEDQQWQKYLMYFGILSGLFFLLVIFLIPFYSGMYLVLALMDLSFYMIAIGYIVAQTGIFMLAMVQIVQTIYFSKDIERLLPLPVKPSSILLSKLTVTYVSQLLLALIIMVPCYIIFGFGESVYFFQWLSLGALIFLAPILPIALAAVIALFVMPAINVSRFRHVLKYVAGFLGIAIFVGVQIWFQTFAFNEGNQTEPYEQLLQDGGPVQLLTTYYPIIDWVIQAVIATNFYLYWVLLFGGHAIIIGLLIVLANRLFLKGLVEMNGGQRSKLKQNKNKKGKDGQTDMAIRIEEPQSPLIALYKKEWRTFLRTPTFFTQCLFSSVMFVFIAFAGSFANISRTGVIGLLADYSTHPMIIWGTASLVFLVGSTNFIAASSISREGKQFLFSKTLPVDVPVHLQAKWLHACSFGGIMAALIFAVAVFVFHAGILHVLVGVLLGIVGFTISTSMGIWTNLTHPHISWTNEKQAFQNGIGSIVYLVLMFLIMIGHAVSVGVLSLIGVQVWIIVLIVLSISSIASYGTYRYMINVGEEKYPSIEK